MSSSLVSGIPPTLFTAHASRTHVKAPQTDFHVKPDNSSGLTHDSTAEMPLRTKVTFQPKKAPKKHRERQAVRGRPSQARINSSPCPFSPRTGTKARRAASRPRRIPPRCPEPWKGPRGHRDDPMAPCLSHRSHRGSASIGLGSQSPWVGIGSPPERDAGHRVTRIGCSRRVF